MQKIFGAALAAALFFVPAAGADSLEVMRGEHANSCSATYSKAFFTSGAVSIIVEQKRYMFGFMMPLVSERIPPGDYPAGLSFDGKAPINVSVHGDDGVYIMALTPDLSLSLRTVQKLTLTVRGKDYVFDADRLAEAMDKTAKCAGVPTVTEIAALRAISTPGHSKWVVLPGKNDDKACHATRLGAEADSVAASYPDGRFTFGVAKMAWALDAGSQLRATIDIDNDPPRTVAIVTSKKTASLFIDPDLEKRLATASIITWHLPWGDFRSETDGFSLLRQELANCIATR